MRASIWRAAVAVTTCSLLTLVGISAAHADEDEDTKPPASDTSTGDGGSSPTRTEDKGGGIYKDVLVITEPWTGTEGTDPKSAQPLEGIPGQTRQELERKGGEKSGFDKKKPILDAPPPPVVNNPNAGKSTKTKDAIVVIAQRHILGPDTYTAIRMASVRDVSKNATVTPDILPGGSGGGGMYMGFSVKTSRTPLAGVTLKDLSAALFAITGGQLASCESAGPDQFRCFLVKPRVVPADQLHRWNILPEGTFGAGVPICSGAIVDGAVGVEVRIPLEDVDCESESGLEPSRFEVERVFVDASYGFPSVASDGSIRLTPTAAAQGHYIPMQVWAVNEDGITSWPFYVIVRTRYAPQSVAPASVEAIRGVETTVPASALFTDVDVDLHLVESGDQLTYEVTNPGSFGGAWFDLSGTLHYRSIDVLGPGEHIDLIRIRATDKWGATAEANIRVPIVEVRPGCANGGTTIDTHTPARVVPHCWLNAPAEYRRGTLTYALTSAPEYGTITGFDTVTGSFTYTPDPAHPGVYNAIITANNNGAVRDTQHTIEVQPAP